jgi:branched-chain amino acid aminotransferase
MTTKFVWHNGELIRWEDANVHVTAHALHYGSSVFEGIRAYATPDGPAVFRLTEHSERLVTGCKISRIQLDYTVEQIDAAIVDLVGRNGHESAYIRPIVFRGAGPLGLEGRNSPTEVFIMTLDWGRYLGSEGIDNGIDVQVSSWRRLAPGTAASLAKIGGQYVNSQFITMEAKDNGFTEGIALDANGYVSEGAGENLFVILDGVIYTPGNWASILAGITRDTAIQLATDLGYEIRFQAIARDMLYMADELFFTGTAAEVTPIRSVDRIEVGNGKPGPITKAIQKEFFAITSGEIPDRHGWLTPVRKIEPTTGD